MRTNLPRRISLDRVCVLSGQNLANHAHCESMLSGSDPGMCDPGKPIGGGNRPIGLTRNKPQVSTGYLSKGTNLHGAEGLAAKLLSFQDPAPKTYRASGSVRANPRKVPTALWLKGPFLVLPCYLLATKCFYPGERLAGAQKGIRE